MDRLIQSQEMWKVPYQEQEASYQRALAADLPTPDDYMEVRVWPSTMLFHRICPSFPLSSLISRMRRILAVLLTMTPHLPATQELPARGPSCFSA